jgi:hypothetical protein
MEMTEDLDSYLEQCLSEIVAGKATVSSCLKRFPHLASALEPMLLVAEELWAVPKPELSPVARTRIEGRVLDAVDARDWVPPVEPKRAGLALGLRLAALGLGGIVIAVFLFTALTPWVGRIASVPPLYRLKWAVEDTWLLLAPQPQEPRLQLTFARRRLDEVQSFPEQGHVDPTVVDAMTQATDAALSDVEELPPLIAVPLVDELVTLIAEQQETLSALQSTAPPTSRDGVEVALQANAAQKSRAHALVSSLPMPPVLTVSETVSPSSIPEPGGVAEFTVRVTNDGAEAVTLTSIINEIRGDPNERGACSIVEEGLRLRPGDAYECTFSAFVFHDAGAAETDTVTAVAVDGEGNTAEVSAAASVTIADVQPAIIVSKMANPASIPEPGGAVRYTVEVHNKSPESVLLSSLADDIYGDLNGRGSCTMAVGGRSLEPGETYSCAFSADVLGNAGEAAAGIVTAVAVDDEGNQARASDAVMVRITDTTPRIMASKTAAPTSLFEPGGAAEFTVRVTNVGAEEITLNSLVDNLHGNLSGRGSCALGPVGIGVGPGESYECSYRERVTGNAGHREAGTVTARAFDDEGNAASASAGAAVVVTDKMPVISVSKAIVRNKIPEPGGEAEYIIAVSNDGAEPVTLTSLTDDLHGDLRGRGTCLASRSGVILDPGDIYECTVKALVSGNAGHTESSSVSVRGVDDEGNQVKASGTATISIVDVLPRIEVSSNAVPESLPEPGGEIEVSLGVLNLGDEDIALVSLVDDEWGDLNGRGTCRIPPAGIPLGSHRSYRCTFSAKVSGNAGDSVTGTLVVAVVDDEGNRVRTAADAMVRFSDVLPAVALVGTANPKEVPEPGGAVDYAISISNQGAEPVVLSSLHSDVHGDLDGRGTCSLPDSGLRLAAGKVYRCVYDAGLTGDARTAHTNRVTVDATDDEGNGVEAGSDVTVTISDLLPVLTVVSSTDRDRVPEPGGPVRFRLEVSNDGAETVRLASLKDTLHGNLSGQGTCLVPADGILLPPDGAYRCGFGADVEGNGGDQATNVITARGSDDEGNDAEASSRARVRITDLQPVIAVAKTVTPGSVPESGGAVQFTIRITNLGAEEVAIAALVDDVFGDLRTRGSCMLSDGISVLPGEEYACAFGATVSGEAGVPQASTVTVRALDDEGNQAEAEDSATVSITDAPPVISVDKTATPGSIPEPGGQVQFGLQVKNEGVEPVALRSLVDSVYGDLNGKGTCSLPPEGMLLAAGDIFDCAFAALITGNAGYAEANTVTAMGSDDEGNQVQASDKAKVTINDVPPLVSVAKTAIPESLPEPGGPVRFEVRVTNDGGETVILTSLVDDVHGNLAGRGTCSVPPEGIPLGPGATYACAFDAEVFGNAGYREISTLTAIAVDDEGTRAEATESTEFTVTDAQPAIEVDKTATPVVLPEPGGLVQFSVSITNEGRETVYLTSLVDDLLGDLGGKGTCALMGSGLAIEPGKPYACTFSKAVSGSAGFSETDTVTAVVADDEGNRVEAADSATVTINHADSGPATAAAGP